MPNILSIQHAFQGVSGLATDRYINTFHVTTTIPPASTDLAGLADAVERFYKPTSGQGIVNSMSNVANGVGRTIKIYDLADAKPRAPIYERVSSQVPYASSSVRNLPAEVSLCMSYDAPKISGSPQARRRGRIYLGPLNLNATTTDAASEPRPLPALVQIILLAGETFADDVGIAGCLWVVYSPTTDSAGVGDESAAATITRCWVDNAFDTQRRRGADPTAKDVRTFS